MKGEIMRKTPKSQQTELSFQVDMSGIRRIAAAIVKMSYNDLTKSSCARMRREARTFFTKSSPWLMALKLHQDFVSKRMANIIAKSDKSPLCSKMKKLRSGDRRCDVCQVTYIGPLSKERRDKIQKEKEEALKKEKKERSSSRRKNESPDA